MRPAKDILSTVDRIYDAVGAPELWSGSVGAVADLVRADHAIMSAQAGEAPFVASARVRNDDLARALDAQRRIEHGRLAVNLLPSDPVVTRSAIMQDQEYERSAHYNEVIRPMNGFHGLMARRQHGGTGFLLALCRPRRSTDFNATDQTVLRAIVPHLFNALRLQCRLHIAEQRYAGLEAALNRLDGGVILTDATARPLFVNDRAGRIVDRLDGLLLGAQLSTTTPAATRDLHQAIGIVATDNFAGSRQILIARRSFRLPLILHLLPIGKLALPNDTRPPRVAIFISEPDSPATINREAFAEIFRLTPREAEVALLLAAGVDLTSAATRLGLGLGTVRHHLKNVYEKTGAHGQAALVALLRGFANQTR